MTVQLHHADAASLGERIAGLVEPVRPADGRGGDELQQLWQTRVTGGSQARWARRLTALGPTPHTIPALLGAMQPAEGVELPWKRSLDALLDDVARLGAATEEKREPSRLVIPFHDLLAPLADVGVARARAGGIDLVVMDVQLPGIDGLAATGMLRADPATRDLPVLAVTAHAMRGDEARILAAGCDGYVAKPIDYHEFLAQVARLLASGRRTRDEAAP